MFCIGDEFESYDDLKETVSTFERTEFVQLNVHQSRFSSKTCRLANLESKKILRFLYLYCSIAVCSKKKTGRCYAETKKKKKGLDFLNLKSVTFVLQTMRFYPTKVSETVRVSRPQKP